MTDAIHAARLLLEKHSEKQKPLHIAFFHLKKAFDQVLRKLTWHMLYQHKRPEKLIALVQLLYHP